MNTLIKSTKIVFGACLAILIMVIAIGFVFYPQLFISGLVSNYTHKHNWSTVWAFAPILPLLIIQYTVIDLIATSNWWKKLTAKLTNLFTK